MPSPSRLRRLRIRRGWRRLCGNRGLDGGFWWGSRRCCSGARWSRSRRCIPGGGGRCGRLGGGLLSRGGGCRHAIGRGFWISSRIGRRFDGYDMGQGGILRRFGVTSIDGGRATGETNVFCITGGLNSRRGDAAYEVGCVHRRLKRARCVKGLCACHPGSCLQKRKYLSYLSPSLPGSNRTGCRMNAIIFNNGAALAVSVHFRLPPAVGQFCRAQAVLRSRTLTERSVAQRLWCGRILEAEWTQSN